MHKGIGLLLTVLVLALPHPSAARGDVRLEITARDIAYEGRSFGERGAYERIAGIAHMRIDPRAPENRGIVDLALAPRDGDGLVRYDVDVVILRPRDPAKARPVLLYDVVNRGSKTLGGLNGSAARPASDPIAAGDGLLMRQGFTMVWSGWQGDIVGKGMVAARFPVVGRPGKPVTGPVSAEKIFDNTTDSVIALPYPAASLDQSQARLTVRALADSPEIVIPARDWSFIDDRQVVLKRPAGMDAGAIYRFRYTARDPMVMGLGFAATRDLIAFLRHASASQGNVLADLAETPCLVDASGRCGYRAGIFSSAIAFGLSQSGRYLRDFLWQGFNRDLAGRRVFDGMMPMIPGARRTFTNFRFAEPGRFSRQHEDHDVPGFTFPFAYATLTDPLTGRSDGILKACSATGTCPKLMHMDTGAEFWQAGASLVGTGGTSHDVAFPENVRAYMIASGAHAPAMAPAMCRLPANPMFYTTIERALLLAMVDWTAGLREPPPSRWPRVDKGELVAVEALDPPSAPSLGLVWPKVFNRPLPPTGERGWPVLVPAVDADGNDIAGIRMPMLAAPKGTYLGWNPRKAGFAEGDLCLIFGSFVPFAANRAAREGDPRLSLEERYPRPETMTEAFLQATEQLRRDGFLLDEDAKAMKPQP